MALTFTSVGTVDYASRRRISVLRAINTTGVTQAGQAVITATVSGTFQEMLWVADLAGVGVNTGASNDAAQVNSTASATALAVADVGTIDAGDCAYGAFAIEANGGTFTQGASFTKLDSENAGGNVRQLITEYSTSDDTPDVTWSVSSGGGGVGFIINGVASLTNQTSGSATSNGASVASISVPNNSVLYIAVAVAAVGGGTVTSISVDGSGFAEEAASGDIAGSADVQFGHVATARGVAAAAASNGLTFAATAAIRGLGNPEGQIAIAFGESATIAGRTALGGSAVLSFAEVAAIRGRAAMSGTVAVVFSEAADLSSLTALSGSASLVFSPTGTLGGPGAINGVAGLVFSTAGDLIGRGVIAGQSLAVFSLAGALLAQGQLAGSTQVQFATSALPRNGLDPFVVLMMGSRPVIFRH